MNRLKILTLLYAILLVSSLAYVTISIPGQKYDAPKYNAGTRADDGLFVVPIENYGYAPMLKHLIDNATKSIHICMEILSDYEPVKTLLDSLVAAHLRGVGVEVLYEGDISSNSYGASYLAQRGVSVKEDSSQTFLHTKMVVIDDRVVYLGSHNWSPYALGKNNEYGILIFNTTIATFYDRYFQSLWNDASSTPLLQNIDVSQGGVSIETTYDGYTYHALKNLIDSASHRLYVAVYTMAYYSYPNEKEELVDNLVNAIVSKKSIASVILDNHDSDNAHDYLQNNGVNVMYDSSSTVTHLKLVIADDSVYIGDANWDYGYLDNETHTVGIVIHNSSIANFFAGYFLTIEKYGDAPYYIPDGYVDTWKITAEPGEVAKINVWLANGGYVNDTSFYLEPKSKLNVSIYQYPSWDRQSVYDWINETMKIEIPENASGTYVVALTFYSKYHHINYTMYLTVEVEGQPVPEFSHLIIPALAIAAVAIWKKRKS